VRFVAIWLVGSDCAVLRLDALLGKAPQVQ